MSPTDYIPREDRSTLDELHEAADRLDAGLELSPALDSALLHGTSIGGARPKATLLDETGVEHIAKFSSSSDRSFQVVNAGSCSRPRPAPGSPVPQRRSAARFHRPRDRLEAWRLTSSVATRRADPRLHAGFAAAQGRLEA
ncbi:HipA domain-containing protein [Rathayibacter agropyri]|uniref:HipA domain-containing protein n=1 Tax=Rathayibacter agropyri TaxID=1634927 RepID=UPI001CA3D39B|nr:HipA domain-containing protein [Rathayibacter agropyri]